NIGAYFSFITERVAIFIPFKQFSLMADFSRTLVIYILKDGKIIEKGTPMDLLKSENLLSNSVKEISGFS
ncbi:hypothetical protein, partial [Mongoliitalea lutea]|uniref:hypothetical protein n=1 Tax=Mongoliitalea lutea TaxID=849756 RepID=UPI001E5DAB7B